MGFYSRFRAWISGHFSLVIIISFLLGLVLPGVQLTPDWSVSLFVGVVMFLACFKVELGEIRRIKPRPLFVFYAGRFLLLPLLLLWAARTTAPEHAASLFLLSLMPVGVAAPAVAGLVGGNVSLVVVLVVFTSAACPFIVSWFSALFLHQEIAVDAMKIFYMLSIIVFLPMLLHLPFRRHQGSREFIDENNNFFSVLIVAIMAVIVVAKRREVIFSDPLVVMEILILLFMAYFLFFLFSHLLMKRFAGNELSSYVLSSGVNNNGLAMSIALIYFPPLCALALVLSEIPWLFGVVAMKAIYGNTQLGQKIAS